MRHGRGIFGGLARWTSRATGQPVAFVTATAIVVVWAVTGPIFGFSDTWQLVINTGTTVVTFLMVFLIQNSANRDTAALLVKLNELIRSQRAAHNALLDVEALPINILDGLERHYAALAAAARVSLAKGATDTGTPDDPALTGT